jgi:hypothetical protein
MIGELGVLEANVKTLEGKIATAGSHNVECEAKVDKLEEINYALTRQLFLSSTQKRDGKPSPSSINFKCKMTEEICDALDLIIEMKTAMKLSQSRKSGCSIKQRYFCQRT